MPDELNLPEGWEVKKLEDIAKINYGYTEKAYFDEIGPKFLRITDIQDNGVEWSKVPFCKCSESDLSKYKLETGDIVFARTGATTGKSHLLNNPQNSVFASYLIRLKLISKNDFVPEFISYYFQTKAYWDKINAGMSGSAQGGFNASKLGELLFSFPKSVAEQKRIVAILDEAFASIAKAKESAEKNLKNANEIFESYLQNVFENKGEEWETKTLGEVCKVIGGGTPSKANDDFYAGDIRWATVRDMKGEIITDTEHKITEDAVKNSSTNVIPKGNVIIATRVGLGKICLIAHDTAINQDLRGVIPNNLKILSVEFLYRWFKSIAHKIVEHGTGATVQGVKLPFVKSLPIPLPPISEQQSIVAKLDALSTETKKFEAIYNQKLADLEELKKSILQKAFEGELK